MNIELECFTVVCWLFNFYFIDTLMCFQNDVT